MHALLQYWIEQFLDAGTGLPDHDHRADVICTLNPRARLALVDNNPLVLTHASARLRSSHPEYIAVIEADEPETILDHRALHQVLDLGRQVGLLPVESSASRTKPGWPIRLATGSRRYRPLKPPHTSKGLTLVARSPRTVTANLRSHRIQLSESSRRLAVTWRDDGMEPDISTRAADGAEALMADEQLGFDVPVPEGNGAYRRPVPDVAPEALGDNETYDYITGGAVKLTDAERVRQRIAEVLVHSYHIDPRDLDRDFPIKVETDSGRKTTRKASIAVFEAGKPHHLDYLRRVVVTKAPPRTSKTVAKIRSYEQAQKDLAELQELMAAVQSCEYGLWTDDVDLYFVHKIDKRFEPEFKPLPNWPMSDETFDATRDTSALAEMRRADRHMLKFAFRRCHNYIHGNEGLPKDAAFWQFLYVLFAKTYDERLGREQAGYVRRFRVDVENLNGPSGRRVLADRIKELFAEVKAHYAKQELFTLRDEITLSDNAIAFITGELAPFDLATTDIDAKGVAYQELVGGNLRGDRGQYFTPHDAVKLVVEILNPREDETIFDPCCGTGGFLRATADHLLSRWKQQERTAGQPETPEDLKEHRRKLAEFADKHLFGADFDPFLRRAASMSVMMLTDTAGHVFNMDSLAFPGGHLPGVEPARTAVPLGSVDVLMTNPPFGSDIPVTDPAVLEQYAGKRHSVVGVWTRDRESGELYEAGMSKAVSPEQLFVQRAIEWVRPGGRIGIVLPNGILSNPGPDAENVRRHILHECWVLASVELPVETFIVEANVNILTTLLFLRRKTEQEKTREANYIAEHNKPEDYPVFMAIAEKVGVDRRGNPVYVRNPDGTVVTEIIERSETFWRKGKKEVRPIRHRQQKVDNDLLLIGGKYAKFVEKWQHEFPWNR